MDLPSLGPPSYITPMVHVKVLRLAYPAKGVVEERRCRITKSARDLDAERDEDGVVVPKHLVELL